MRIVRKLSGIFVLLVLAACTHQGVGEAEPVNLRCEYMREALIAKPVPRFSWEFFSTEKGQVQTAWQVIVSDDYGKIVSDKGSVWDSRKNPGSETFGIRYGGAELQSFTRYHWKVRVWDRDGKVSEWSEPGSFITGAFDEKDWEARWIGDEAEEPLEYPLLYKHIGYLSSYTDDRFEEKWVQVDLGEALTFNRIRLYPSYNNKKEIRDYYYPLAFRIEVSEDGKEWTPCIEQDETAKPGGQPGGDPDGKSDSKTSRKPGGDPNGKSAGKPDSKTIAKPGGEPNGKPADFAFEMQRGRYVRFTATKLQQYDHRIFDYEDHGDPDRMFAFSLAELEVLQNENVLSKGCKVSCRDALIKIDREDGYDPEMLTDGIYGTPPPPERRPVPPSPLLRKVIDLKDDPVQAIAYVSALGVYDLCFNSQSPDGRVLSPEWTDYHKRVQYQAYDVSKLLVKGTNVVGVQLADGWYAGMLGPTRWSPYFPKRGGYGLDRRFFFQMEVEYADGEKELFFSDDTWKIYPDGPIRMADNFLGETYDANKEVEGWQSKDFDDSDWEDARVDSRISVNLVPQVNQAIRTVETLEARSVLESKEGHFIFDVGENIAGWCSIKIKGNPGDTLVLRHGEMLDEDGELYTENLSAAVQTDSIILGVSGEMQFEPRFTYHGFRFVEVKGLRGTPGKDILEAKVVASDLPKTGSFACSNPMLNQLYKNLNRSHMSNMHGVPTDCPQRDERCGWMGDVYIFAQTSIFNRDMAAFYSKWLVDILDAQSERGTFPDIAPHPFAYEKHFTNAPGWADAAIKLPYLMYLNYGDQEMLEENFEAYRRYVENIRKSNPDLIWRSGLGLNYGDWLNGNTIRAEGFPRTGAQIPSEVFSTIMFYHSVNTLSKMAQAIGKQEESDSYAGLAASIKDAFLEEFVDEGGRIEGDAQACYAMALHYELYSPELEQAFEQRMIEKFIPYAGRMNTGFHSTIPLMKELVKRGYTEKAFDLLETTEFPSWGYSIEQGATSMWERWDSYVKGRGLQGAGMNSFNHYAFGAIGEWMYENILGIQPEPSSPGFRHFTLKPVPGGTLEWARGSYHSISGPVEVSWELDGNDFEYHFTIPANTTARVHIPGISMDQVWLDGKILTEQPGVKNIRYEEGYVVAEFPSGSYSLRSRLPLV